MRSHLWSLGLAALLTTVVVTVPRDAGAFCGFYVSGADTKLFNNATQVVLLRSKTRTVISMQNNYQGPPEKFAMVVPVPVVLQKENVKTLKHDVFAKIDQLSSPRLVEYWEQDPCYVPPPDEAVDLASAPAGIATTSVKPKEGAGGVTIEAQFTVGEYEIVILSAKDAGGLDAWLRSNKYSIPTGAEAYLRPYVTKGSKFFVAKVDPEKVKFTEQNGQKMATLSPLRFHYDEESFSLPIRLGLINAKEAQDLIVNVLSENQRFEVANYPNTTIPTNLDVAEKARGEFGTFYAALFDKTLEKNPRAVVTEYSWASNTCDPCPGPTLDGSDINTFGGDTLPSASSAFNYVVTRLHARYTKDTLGEDLVFKAAEPIVGGRESMGSDGKTLEHGAQKSSYNNFQARYAIRHPWTGPITCKEPRRNIWGGPPPSVDGGVAASQPRAPLGKDLAFAPRGAGLAPFVRSAIPELGFTVDPKALPPVSGVIGTSKPTSSTNPSASTDVPPEPKKKCGCEVVGVPTNGAMSVTLTAMTTLLTALRRRKKAVTEQVR